jgi:hypothetical protein
MHSSRSERSPRIIDVSEVHGKRSDIGLRHNRSAQGVANDRSHRGGNGRTVHRRKPGAQVIEQLILRPWNGRRIGVGQRRRDPVVDYRSCVSVSDFFGAERVARRMTSAAITERLC